MNINRRLLLQIPVVLAGPLSAPPGKAAQMLPAPSAETPDLAGYAKTLSGYVDTLLPADGDSPAASSLGIPERMLAVAQRQPPYARLMKAGCEWLDASASSRAGKPFGELGEKDRVDIIAAAQASDRHSVQWSFFRNTHRHAMGLFYSHPKSWPALDYPGPPQPHGFPDHAQPPKGGAA